MLLPLFLTVVCIHKIQPNIKNKVIHTQRHCCTHLVTILFRNTFPYLEHLGHFSGLEVILSFSSPFGRHGCLLAKLKNISIFLEKVYQSKPFQNSLNWPNDSATWFVRHAQLHLDAFHAKYFSTSSMSWTVRVFVGEKIIFDVQESEQNTYFKSTHGQCKLIFTVVSLAEGPTISYPNRTDANCNNQFKSKHTWPEPGYRDTLNPMQMSFTPITGCTFPPKRPTGKRHQITVWEMNGSKPDTFTLASWIKK